MVTISVRHAEMDDPAKERIEVCVATPTILRQILRQFSDGELLTLSLVNKKWNFEARSVLKGRGNLTARLSTGCACQSLAAFTSDLEQMRVVPFSGVHLVISHPYGFQSPSNGSLESSFNVILDRLPCKNFSLSFIGTCWKNCEDCPALVLVKRIMEVYCGAIEKFSLTLESDEYEEMFEQVFQPHWELPYLKTFKIKADMPDDGALRNFAKALVSHAPNLEELNFDGAIIFQEDLLKGSRAVLVPAYEFLPAFELVCDSMMSSVRAEKIAILPPYVGVDVDFLNRAVPMVLEASRTTLTSLRMDLLSVIPLMCYGICLENVTTFEICMHSDSLRVQSPVLALVQDLDFARIFPQLEHVKIEEHRELAFELRHVSGFIEQGNAVSMKTSPDRSMNIKHLTLIQSCWISTEPFWVRMFPNIVKLWIDMGSISPFPFTILWEGFVKLEELFVTSAHLTSSTTVNLDSVFCGIFPEEVAELEGKDDEYLKAVNIVPVMPSIGCMRDLRTLTLDHTLRSYTMGDLDPKSDHKYLFSKVTALVGFARCPALAVTFAVDSHTAKALSHMEPYVSFIITAPDVPGIKVFRWS